MKITLEQLLQKVKEADPRWAICEQAASDGSDGFVGRIDHGRIDIWRFDDFTTDDVAALMVYICTAAIMLPRLEAALRNLHDRKLISDPDGDHMQEVEELLKEINEIEL